MIPYTAGDPVQSFITDLSKITDPAC